MDVQLRCHILHSHTFQLTQRNRSRLELIAVLEHFTQAWLRHVSPPLVGGVNFPGGRFARTPFACYAFCARTYILLRSSYSLWYSGGRRFASRIPYSCSSSASKV